MQFPLIALCETDEDTPLSASGRGYLRLGLGTQTGCETDTSPIPMTIEEAEELLKYLARTRAKADSIRENAPAGSYLDSVLQRISAGLDHEISQLRYLTLNKDPATTCLPKPPKRMRPAL